MCSTASSKSPRGEPLPARLVAKSWTSLWQPKLNVAWLPPESVFLRVIELPKSTFERNAGDGGVAVGKILAAARHADCLDDARLGTHTAPARRRAPENLQTVIVVIAGRAAVEEFLGKLEKDGFLADRLEAPMLDQLEAAPRDGGRRVDLRCRSAGRTPRWWRGGASGALRNLSLIVLPPEGDRAKSLKDQLAQLCWSGEMEGWLTAPPQWHLVADPVNAAEWENLLRDGAERAGAGRAAAAAGGTGGAHGAAGGGGAGAALLPAEFSARYHQQFVDRLWLRGLVTTGILYAIGVVIYFCATTVLNYKTVAVEQQAAQLGDSYTNVLQLKARYAVLAERQQLKYAALDCWKIVAEQLPAGLTLQRSSFADGQKLTLNGICSPDQISEVISDPGEFYDAIRKAKLDGQDMFDPTAIEPLIYNQSGNTVNWHFALQLKHGEAAP